MIQRKSAGAEEYLSPSEAGRIAGVTGEAVKQWIYGRKLAATKLPNGYWRISRSDLEGFLASRKGPAKRRILIASADPAVASAARSALGSDVCEITTAANKMDALMKAVDGKPAAIFIDLSDRRMDGLALAGKLRGMRGFKRLPLIFLAGGKGPPAADENGLIKLRAQGLLAKPLSGEEIAAEIEKLFPGD